MARLTRSLPFGSSPRRKRRIDCPAAGHIDPRYCRLTAPEQRSGRAVVAPEREDETGDGLMARTRLSHVCASLLTALLLSTAPVSAQPNGARPAAGASA